jgi:hypothetical protein
MWESMHEEQRHDMCRIFCYRVQPPSVHIHPFHTIHPQYTARRRFPVTSARMSLPFPFSLSAGRLAGGVTENYTVPNSPHRPFTSRSRISEPYSVHAPCSRESNKAKGKINSKQLAALITFRTGCNCWHFSCMFCPGRKHVLARHEVVTMSQKKS